MIGRVTADAFAESARARGMPAWARLLTALALLKIVASLGGVLIQVGAGGWLYAVLFAHVVAFGGAGVVLLQLGGADRRAVHLGIFYLLVASAFADPFVRAFASSAPGLRSILWPLAHLHVTALGPFLFWLFVREFPRRAAVWERSRFGDGAVAVALSVGVGLLLSNLALAVFPPEGRLASALAPWVDRARPGSLFWPLLFVIGLPTLPFAFLQARLARLDERRRARVLLAGLILGLLPDIVVTLAAAVSETFRTFATSPRGMALVGVFVYPALLSIPASTAYAVLVHRALDVRLIARRALQYALARQTLLLAALVPFAAGAWIVFMRRDRPVAALATGATGSALLVAVLAGLGATRLRRTLLDALDRHFFREQYDARRILAGLVTRVRTMRDPAELATVVADEVDRALHVDGVDLLLPDRRNGLFNTVSRRLRASPAHPRFAHHLESSDGPLELDWTQPPDWLTSLPDEEQRWLSDARARLLVPLLSRGGTVDGILLVGEKRSELPFTQEDRLLLAAIAESAALALETSYLSSGSGVMARAAGTELDDLPARECRACHAIAAVDRERCERCGGELIDASLPALVAGKFRPLERIGSGGMGVVYRALDLSLDRDVALKTLPRMAAPAAARLRREARSMAAVSHANLAAIFGVESWHGSPILVVEYLPGGTLADRLAHGALGVSDALDLCTDLLRGLERLHRAGILHRDIKPSNVGFAADGTPRLLDLGVAAATLPRHAAASARLALDAAWPLETVATAEGALVGTIAYLPPEALDGRSAHPSLDLWGIAMLLYEALAGRHPFANYGGPALVARIATVPMPDVREYSPAVPEPVALLLTRALARDSRRRPASAAEFLDNIRETRTRMTDAESALVG